MRKDKCIQRWLENNHIQTQVIAKLANSKDGKLTIASSLLIPLTLRLHYYKDKLKIGRGQLGYTSCIKEMEEDLEQTIVYLEDFLPIFYKKDYRKSPLKQLLALLEEAKQLKWTITSSSAPNSFQKDLAQSSYDM